MEDLWDSGLKKLKKIDMSCVRKAKKERLDRKPHVNCEILYKVIDLKKTWKTM